MNEVIQTLVAVNEALHALRDTVFWLMVSQTFTLITLAATIVAVIRLRAKGPR